MPLPSYKLTPHTRPADYVLYRRELFELDPPYQRASTWGLSERQDLLKSLLMGLPTGSIVLNMRPEHGVRAVVDGKQRIETLRAFYDGEFGIPAEWVDPRWVGTTVPIEYDGATVDGVVLGKGIHPFDAVVENFPLSFIEAQVSTVAEEAVIFGLVNSGGVAQTPADLARAQKVAGS